MTDFFISYTGADREWAEWIAYVLEEEGYEVVIQAWDFRPGSNFVAAMQDAASRADRTIMVLSPAYLKSSFAEPEWIAAFAKDPKGLDQALVPVMVEAVAAPGLLSAVVQIRIAGLSEDAARQTLLTGIDRKRAKPSARPAFPGSSAAVEPKSFPGASVADVRGHPEAEPESRSTYIPKLASVPTDMDRRRFMRGGFDTVRQMFERNAAETTRREPRIHIDIDQRTSADMRAELYVDGASRNGCRVWIGGQFGEDKILYAEGRHFSDNSCNDMIAVVVDGGLFFSSTMSMGFSQYEKEHDVKKMSPDDLAEFIWQRFVSRLPR